MSNPTPVGVPIERLTVSHTYMNIADLLKDFDGKKIVVNTEYQRSEVWREPKKRLLIDSLLKGYSISTVILRDRRDGTSEVLDGQQRLVSLSEFTHDKFSFRTDDVELASLDGLLFSKLPPLIQYARLLGRTVQVTRISSDDEGVVTELFLRLQEGTPLNNPERLHAVRGMLRDTVLELAREGFLKHSGVSDYRFNHRYIMAQAIALELQGIQAGHYVQPGFRLLKSLHWQYETLPVPPDAVTRLRTSSRFLSSALQKSAPVVNRNTDALTLLSAGSYLLSHYALKSRASEFDQAILSFLDNVENSARKPFTDYAEARTKSTLSRKSIQKRFEILVSEVLGAMPDLVLLDPNREFDRGMKLALYRRAKGKCEECGRPVSFASAEADHTFAWSKGGPTSLSNGRYLCLTCNRKKGAR